MANLVNHSRFVRPSDHPSVAYIKQEEIGAVLSRALADLYNTKPKNQLHFLGNWLLNHAASMREKQAELQREENKELLKEKYSKSIQERRELEEEKILELEKNREKEEEFKGRIRNTLDVDDFLDELVQYLKNETHSAAVYIGKLEKVKKPITLLDHERAHIDEDAPMVIRYISASKGSELMIGKVLIEEEGEATYSIWKEEEPVADDPEEGHEKTLKKEKAKMISVDDVVNDRRIKFFDVPKLGAYFAIPLTYKSCLSESSFDAGVEDNLECRRLKAQQEEEKQKSEHQSNKEEEEEKVYEEIVESPYKVFDVKLVIAADTLGQDRVFTESEKQFIIEWANFIKLEWERAEIKSLKHDINEHVAQHYKDQQRLNDKHSEWHDEEKNVVDEAVRLADVSVHDDVRHIEGQVALLELLRTRLIHELPDLFEFVHYKVVKFSRVFQLAFYLQGIDHSEIVEPRTNMIS